MSQQSPLTSLFSSHADTAIDLLEDRRPFVRAAAVQALARTNNNTLTPFLWEMVDDDEPFVAEAAARIVASAPDVVAEDAQTLTIRIQHCDDRASLAVHGAR